MGGAADARVVGPDQHLEAGGSRPRGAGRGPPGRRPRGRPRWPPGSGLSAARSGRGSRDPARRPRTGGGGGRAGPPWTRRRSPARGVNATRGARRRTVAVDQVPGLGAGVEQLHGAGDDGAVDVGPDGVPQARRLEGLRGKRVEPVRGERDPRRRAPGGRPGPSCVRAWRALVPSRWCSSNASPHAPGARSRPSVETIRPSLYGYSAAMAQGHERLRVLEGRRVPRGDQARPSPATARRRVERRGARHRGRRGGARLEKPPTRTEIGWTGRPPSAAISWLPVLLSARPCSTTARWSAAIASADGYPR